MLVMAIGIAVIWSIDIVRSPEIDRSRGLMRARDRSGSVLLLHRIAEHGTAAVLAMGGLGLVLGWPSGAWPWIVPVGLGALAYTALNSQAWVLAERSRLAYGIPMAIGLAGSVIAIALLVGGAVVLD